MKTMKLPRTFLVVGICIGCVGCTPEGTDVAGSMAVRSVPDEGPPRDPESWWREIRDAKVSIEYGEHKDPAIYWCDTLRASHIALWRHLASASDNDLRYLVSRFGTAGSQADFRLMFCDPYLTVDQGRFFAWPLTKKKDGISSEGFSVLRGKIARFQTEHFWNNRVTLQRYCHALMWRGRLTLSGECYLPVTHVEAGLASKDDNEFWYYARNVLVYAFVTGRMDLIRGVTRPELEAGFSAWCTWFLANRDWLIFDRQSMTWRVDRQATVHPPIVRPPHPFPDWDGPPVPGGVIFTFQSNLIAK